MPELGAKIGANTVLSLLEQGADAEPSAHIYLERYHQQQRRTTWDYEPDRIVRRGLEDDSFLACAAHVRESGLAYNVIIIDGMARRRCTEFAVDCLTESGFIILDNSNRSDYDAAFDILAEAGFFPIPFWGLVPGAPVLTRTSIFARRKKFLPHARFRSNSFGLPEYEGYKTA